MRNQFTNSFFDSTIEEGISYAKSLSENQDYNKIYRLLHKLEEMIDCLEELKNGETMEYFDSKLIHGLGLDTLIRKIDLLRVAICFFYSKISINPTTYGFTIINISGLTQNKNYIHKIRNHFGVEFCVALKTIVKEKKDGIDYHQLDFNQFTIHPCLNDGINWLFINTQCGTFNCKFCHRIITHKKILSELDAHDNFSISLLSLDDFDLFFKNNLKDLEGRLTSQVRLWNERHFNAKGGNLFL